jgi:hypothetical protein
LILYCLKVTRRIREDQYADGLRQKREGRKNHSEVQITKLLAVPRYADANVSDTDGEAGEKSGESVLVSSPAAWRKQVAKWQSEMQEVESDSDTDNGPRASQSTGGRRRASWLPIKLDKLFGGDLPQPIRIRPQVVSEEALYIQLLAAEHSGEEPDDGELEGSGDDYCG